ncbi:MAG: hypothetical protein LQ344_004166 [Seirophora lacunosa]|nr:MAG: hypothetical protein LQ344_004166 [Seirophora lacunosa]
MVDTLDNAVSWVRDRPFEDFELAPRRSRFVDSKKTENNNTEDEDMQCTSTVSERVDRAGTQAERCRVLITARCPAAGDVSKRCHIIGVRIEFSGVESRSPGYSNSDSRQSQDIPRILAGTVQV